MRDKIEILSPAGSFESLQAAIQGGADAIYFGVDHLNMRARSADNFRLSDLHEIKSRCAEAGVSAYLTLNTVIFDHDLPLMKKIIDEAVDAKLDAVIACDHAVLNYANQRGLPVHVSTQANISNYEAVKFYSRFADVMVLARELTLQQVKHITEKIKIEELKGPSGEKIKIEVFSHGALCMAISGKCYLSLHTHNASANRGACKQNCRDKYIVEDEEGNQLKIENEYIMSSKDLQTISFLDKVLDAGVSVLKIEGRGKSPEYVKEVTACYKEAVNSYYEGKYSIEKIRGWIDRLRSVYNRGFWEGYYLGRKMGEWTETPGSISTKIKSYLGKGRNYFQKSEVAEFILESDQLNIGDEIMVTGPKTGVINYRVENLRRDESEVSLVKKGEIFTLKLPFKIRPSDKLYKITERKK
ncbi:MAG: peptidase U32 family protein [Cytophagaceae bacterium]